MLNALRKRNQVLPAMVFSLGIVCSVLLISISVILGFLGCLITLFLTYLELVTQWSFRAPPRRKPALEDARFERHMVVAKGQQLAHYIAAGRPGMPLVWMCHGWTSASCRMIDRADSFLNRGWSVLLVDLPGHGISDGLEKWSAEESTSHLIEAINQLQRKHPELFGAGIIHYGHSIGAFIGLRISKRRRELNEGMNVQGWIMESPMTGYTEIFEETCNILRIPSALRPIVLRKTLRHFNARNKGVASFNRLAEADVPAWGMPRERALLVQAIPDERLGSIHHERLIRLIEGGEDPSLLTTSLLDDLTHSGSHESPSRKAAVDAWLDEHFQVHSSA